MVKKFEQPMKEKKRAKNGQALAIVCLVLNVLLLPGLGSLIYGKTREGIWQIVLHVLGVILIFSGILLSVSVILLWIGVPMIILGTFASAGAWIWSLVTGIQIIKESN